MQGSDDSTVPLALRLIRSPDTREFIAHAARLAEAGHYLESIELSARIARDAPDREGWLDIAPFFNSVVCVSRMNSSQRPHVKLRALIEGTAAAFARQEPVLFIAGDLDLVARVNREREASRLPTMTADQAQAAVAGVALDLLAAQDALESILAALPLPADLDDRLEHRRPYDVATSLMGAIECALEDCLRPAVESLQRCSDDTDASLRAEFEGGR